MFARTLRSVRGAVACLLFLVSLPLFAQATGSISGRVVNSAGVAVASATVTLTELNRSVLTDSEGRFEFRSLPPRHYHVVAQSPRAGFAVAEAPLAAGASIVIELSLDPLAHVEEIVVTASGEARRESEIFQPVSAIARDDLLARIQPTLGETLSTQPGVTGTSFAPGASRPVIRGLGADRVRILDNGIGTGDVSNVSPDHAVSLEPAMAERVEIVRGPATLMYGGNAIGGVVNVLSDRIPSRLPTSAVFGAVDLQAGSVADERFGSVTVGGGAGSFAWHFDASDRSTGDYEIPGPADRFDDPDHFDGFLENSFVEARSFAAGGSWITDRGFIGIGVNRFNKNYGIPGHAHHDDEGEEHDEEEEDEEAGVRADLEQRRVDLRGQINDLGPFTSVRFAAGRTDYEHDEIEGDVLGTRFTSDGYEARVEAFHRPVGRMYGTFGAQLIRSDLIAEGEEAFIPPNETAMNALFAFEEWRFDRWNLQAGARYEQQDVSTDADGLPDRSFDAVSGSLGAIFRPRDGWSVALSLSRAARVPTATELYAEGPHAATAQFEIGDPDLDNETSLGADLSIRGSVGIVRGELNLFSTRFDGFIYDSPTEEFEDDLPVYQFVQRDARFRGAEIVTHTPLWHSATRHLELEAGADYVRATLDEGGNLPRIPPFRMSVGLRYQGGPWSARAEARRVDDQDRVAVNELPTDGYTLINAQLGYRFFIGSMIHDIQLRGANLTNELARNHVSPLKERAPLPGRDIALAYRLSF
jgi:iron complex outermembrane recepter protein